MALSFSEKQAIVAEVSQEAQDAISLVVADYRGLTVPQLTELRKQARDKGVYLRVVRNTLAKRAIKGTGFECMEAALTGPLVYGFAKNEPSAAARLFKDFAKDADALEVKALSVGSTFYAANQLDVVASLPTLDEARSMLAGVLMAPVNQLARTVSEPANMLVRALDGHAKSKS